MAHWEVTGVVYREGMTDIHGPGYVQRGGKVEEGFSKPSFKEKNKPKQTHKSISAI